ncbi:MAG: LTA synthase family protein [Defluviitaleaceae bacterium]|nr:LTA synthase family protein [Defluviitaleaceae bacterium]
MIKELWSKLIEITHKKQIQWALRAYACIFPLLLFLTMEGLNPTSAEGLMASPHTSLDIVLFSSLFIALCVMVVFTFTGRVFWSYVIVSVVLGVGYVVNNLKLMVTGQVFVPTDIMLAEEAFAMAGGAGITIEMTLLLHIALIATLHLPLVFVSFKPDFTKRWFMFSGAIFIFVLTFGSNFYTNTIMSALEINPRGPLTALYRDTGFIMGFHAALMDHHTRNANAGTASHTAQDFFGWHEIEIADGSNNVQPNVIIIMSEAFMDPTVIYNLDFYPDPVSNFRRLTQNHISGDLVVPVFGGGTANTEMEFLTGSPQFFMGSAYYVPFNNVGRYFFRDTQTAMPWLFRLNGYHTVAIHPFTRYFYNRNVVYDRLGFNNFIAYEDMEDPVYKGLFVSDEFFTDEIISQILLAEQANEPLFLFGISMQNHWEYWGSKYYGWMQDVFSSSPYLTQDELDRVDSFAQGIYDADKQLGRLIDFIESRDTPTIVVFFGDHLPILGYHSDRFFEGLGYISDQRPEMWNEDDRRKMFTLPYLVWNNFTTTDEDWGTISTYFLAAQTLHHSGIDLNRYWHYILYANSYFSALTENHYVDMHGDFHTIWDIWNRNYVIAMEALIQAMWFGTDDFHYSLSEVFNNER